MVVIPLDRLLPFGGDSANVILRVIVGVRHLAPDEIAQPIRPVQKAGIFDLLMLAGPVEAHLLRQFDIPLQGFVAGSR